MALGAQAANLVVVDEGADARLEVQERARARRRRDYRLQDLQAELDGPASDEELETIYADIDRVHADYATEIAQIEAAFA